MDFEITIDFFLDNQKIYHLWILCIKSLTSPLIIKRKVKYISKSWNLKF